MTNLQLTKLLLLYKEALKNNLSSIDFVLEIREAKIDLDKSFIQQGKEDENLGNYINELLILQSIKENE